MNPKPLLSAVLVAALAVPAAHAAEFRLAIGNWDYELAGEVTDQGRTYDYNEDLELETGGKRSVRVELDTGPGAWPDFAATSSKLAASGDHEETFTVVGGPIPVTETRTIEARADFDDFDLTARYPIAVGRAALSLGLTVKRLRGEIFIADSEQDGPSRQDYDETIPELHAQVRWPIGRALAASAVLQGIEYDGSRATEWRASAELRLFRVLLLEAGWQEKRYEVNVGSYRMDTRLDGALLRGGLAF